MLPEIAVKKPVASRRRSLALALCAMTLLGVPTFSGTAQSQETKTPTEPVPVGNDTSSKERQKSAEPDQKEPTKPDSTRPKKDQGVPEAPRPEYPRTKVKVPLTPEMAELVDQYNAALKERRYGDAEEIARKAKLLEPANPSTEIMLWKAKFALRNDGNKNSANGPAANQLPEPLPTERLPVAKIGPPSVEYLPRPSLEDQRIVRELDERASFDLDDVPLTDVVKQISQQHKINVVIDYAAFRPNNPFKEIRIPPLKVNEISLRNALKLILDPHQLTYVVENEVLKIAPLDAVLRQTTTRIYPVRDLVGESQDFESLIMAIEQSVARGSWNDSVEYGGRATKVPASGSLVIHHNLRVQGEVLQLLRGLREAKEISANP